MLLPFYRRHSTRVTTRSCYLDNATHNLGQGVLCSGNILLKSGTSAQQTSHKNGAFGFIRKILDICQANINSM